MYSEFQIGNYVSFENEYYKITNIQKYNDKVYYQIEGLENDKKIELKCYAPTPICLDKYVDNIMNQLYGYEVLATYINNVCWLYYIHELQDAYKKLYNKELNIIL